MDLVEVELARVVIHQKGDQQFIHLRERHGSRGFPIVIGFNEVEEINRKLSGLQTPRPLTHDLVGRLIKTLGWRLARVVITELRDGTFYAELTLERGGERSVISSRPSDAIALAVRYGDAVPIFAAEAVLDEAGVEFEAEEEEQEVEQFREFLDTISPEDFAT